MIGHLFGPRASVYDNYTKPSKFHRNLIVIGGGSAGLICGLIAASIKAKVTLVESGKMGGDCLNTGCVPSKACLLYTSPSPRDKRQSRMPSSA